MTQFTLTEEKIARLQSTGWTFVTNSGTGIALYLAGLNSNNEYMSLPACPVEGTPDKAFEGIESIWVKKKKTDNKESEAIG